jgi:ribosomal protein L37AE/L43A
MTERNYDAVSDLTMRNVFRGEGLAYRRRCFECNQSKEQTGGSTSKKLKIWRCAACTTKAKSGVDKPTAPC